jgi:DNA-binding IclR family transcriptional regulator
VNAPAATHALKVLRLLARHASPLPASVIAQQLELPRSSTYHLLKVLDQEGFVTHLPDQRRYGLGPAAFEIGSAYSRQESLRWIAQQVLTRLVKATTHNAHLAVLHNRDVLYVIEERAPDRPALVTDVGVRLPAHLTASGLAMLAKLPPQQLNALFPSRRELTRRYDAGPDSLTQLRALLQQANRRGYAEEDGFVTPGLASVATAVLDHSEHPVAAVALTFPETTTDDRPALAAHVQRAARQVSERIHGVTSPAAPPRRSRTGAQG